MNGDDKTFKPWSLPVSAMFKRLVKKFCTDSGVDESIVSLEFDGEALSLTSTPQIVDLEDDDIIEIKLQSKPNLAAEPNRQPIVVSVRRNNHPRQVKKFKIRACDPISKISGGFISKYKKAKVRVKLYLNGTLLNESESAQSYGIVDGTELMGMDNGKDPPS